MADPESEPPPQHHPPRTRHAAQFLWFCHALCDKFGPCTMDTAEATKRSWRIIRLGDWFVCMCSDKYMHIIFTYAHTHVCVIIHVDYDFGCYSVTLG